MQGRLGLGNRPPLPASIFICHNGGGVPRARIVLARHARSRQPADLQSYLTTNTYMQSSVRVNFLRKKFSLYKQGLLHVRYHVILRPYGVGPPLPVVCLYLGPNPRHRILKRYQLRLWRGLCCFLASIEVRRDNPSYHCICRD